MQLNASRIKNLQAQEDFGNAVKEEAAKQLLKVNEHGFFNHHHHQYKHLLKYLIVQCLLRLKEPSVLLRCRKKTFTLWSLCWTMQLKNTARKHRFMLLRSLLTRTFSFLMLLQMMILMPLTANFLDTKITCEL
ncbi:unnamed protein product [Eruca vesicaria subsp. sativa]|uniref:Uncharacterized protein n=1 Tax=Eruca vesicaria subsp. sativa TaxID=29727 RepID=A0ABC8KNV2_ERUVS|nr:unnamed protein product [Eruca vesicaria subsp. sativa]